MRARDWDILRATYQLAVLTFHAIMSGAEQLRLAHLSNPRVLALGFVLVFALRIVYVCSLPNKIDSWRDGRSYDSIARNLVSGVGYWDKIALGEPVWVPFANPSAPTTRWMPGYPVFLAGIYWIFGPSYRAVYIAQAFLACAIAWLLYLLGKQTIGEQAGILAVFIYAVDFFSIFICGMFATEQLFTLLVLGSLYCFLQIGRRAPARLLFSALFGLSSAAAALTRNVAGLMFGGLCLLMLFGWRLNQVRWSKRIGLATVAAAIFVLCLTPWLVRNHRLTGHYVLSTETWATLAMQNNDKGGVYDTLPGLIAMPRASYSQSEIQREAVYKHFVINWIRTHSGTFALLYLERMAAFWSPSLHDAAGLRRWMGLTFNLGLLLLAGVYVITQIKSLTNVLPILVTLLIFSAGYSLAFVTTRFKLPVYPLIELLAAGGALSLVLRCVPTRSIPVHSAASGATGST